MCVHFCFRACRCHLSSIVPFVVGSPGANHDDRLILRRPLEVVFGFEVLLRADEGRLEEVVGLNFHICIRLGVQKLRRLRKIDNRCFFLIGATVKNELIQERALLYKVNHSVYPV